MSNDSPKETTKSGSTYITSFWDGAVGMNVFLKEGLEGHLMLTYTPTRCYRQKNGKTGYSKEFFHYNEPGLRNAAKDAAAFCKKYQDDPEAAVVAGEELQRAKKSRYEQQSVSPDATDQALAA